MDRKDFEALLNKYPDCVSDGKKLKAYIKDLYPDVPKAIVNTLTIMADDGIISEMQMSAESSMLVAARLQKKLEDDYGLSQKIISECFSLIIYDSAKQTKSTINAGTYEKITSFIDTQPTFELRKEVPQKLDILQPEYDPKDFKIVKGGLKKYKGRSSVVAIPDNVTRIGADAFSGCTGLTSVTIPDSVTSIGNSAFSGCKGLTSITIPDSVTSIGNWAFRYCEKLQDIYITDIAAWCNISGLDNLMDYGSSNKKLYINNELATSITIPDSVTSIGHRAFCGCSGLTSVTIPDSVTSIGYDAFYNTAWYNNQPDGLVYAGKVAYKYKGTAPWCTSIVLKEGTLGIGAYVFYGCEGLTSITIPNSVTSIGNNAFSGCEGLTSITIPNSVTSIGNNAFSGCEGLTSIIIPDSMTSIGSQAFYQ